MLREFRNECLQSGVVYDGDSEAFELAWLVSQGKLFRGDGGRTQMANSSGDARVKHALNSFKKCANLFWRSPKCCAVVVDRSNGDVVVVSRL